MSMNKIYRISYVLLHGLFTFVEWMYMIIGYLNLTRSNVCSKLGLQYSKRNIGRLPESLPLIKIPEHLTVLLGPEEVFIHELANLVLWCLETRISFISFYDHTGTLNNMAHDFQDEVSRRKNKADHVIWHSDQKTLPKNGFCNRKVYVKILTGENGRENIVNLARDLVSRQHQSLGIEAAADYLRRNYCFPDPEMGLLCSKNLCFYGYPPWEIRVTEFLQINSVHNITFSNFLELLCKYSKREQRLGK